MANFQFLKNHLPIEITLLSDKSQYNFDETAIIAGTVSEKVYVEFPTFQTEPILINISGPNFERSGVIIS